MDPQLASWLEFRRCFMLIFERTSLVLFLKNERGSSYEHLSINHTPFWSHWAAHLLYKITIFEANNSSFKMANANDAFQMHFEMNFSIKRPD